MVLRDFDTIALMLLVIGLYSLVARRNREARSSWPTWLLIPVVLVMTIHWAVLYRNDLHPYHLLRPSEFLVFALVLGRWTFALWRRERSAGWVFYLLLPVAQQLIFWLLIMAFTPG